MGKKDDKKDKPRHKHKYKAARKFRDPRTGNTAVFETCECGKGRSRVLD